MQTITKNKIEIPIQGHDVDRVVASSLFTNWFDNLDDTYIITKIVIQSLDQVRNKILFIKLSVTIITEGVEHSVIVFLHHKVVSGLCILKCEEVRYIVVVNQRRIPAGRYIYELPSGLIDDENTAEVTILRELEEEAGLVTHLGITNVDIHPLFEPNKFFIESPGVMNKSIFPFYLEKEISRKELDQLNNLHAGLKEEHEHITVKLVPYDQFTKYCKDSSSLTSLYLYEHRND